MTERFKLLLLIAVYLLLQTATLAHAAEHAFHESEASCEVYFAAKNSGHGLVDSSPADAETLIAPADCGKPAPSFPARTTHCFFARAPPLIP